MTQRILTVSDLLEEAAAIERAAARRYAQLAAAMKNAGNAELETLFRQLQHEEESHLQTLRQWGSSAPEAQQQGGPAPEVSSDEEETFDPYTLTTYNALGIAVRNEDRAFAFFSGVAADAKDREVRELAKRLAHEELAHAAKLRQARREAYRAKDRRSTLDRWGLADTRIDDFAAFRAIAHRLEAGLAARHEALAARLAGSRTPGAEAIGTVARRSREAAVGLGAIDGPDAREAEVGLPTDVPSALRDMLVDLEEACSFYMGVGENGPDEPAVAAAQRLAYGAVSRLAVIRGALSQHAPPPAG